MQCISIAYQINNLKKMQVTGRVQYIAGGPCCFPSLPVRVYKFSSHYLNNRIFIDISLGSLATESPGIRGNETAEDK